MNSCIISPTSSVISPAALPVVTHNSLIESRISLILSIISSLESGGVSIFWAKLLVVFSIPSNNPLSDLDVFSDSIYPLSTNSSLNLSRYACPPLTESAKNANIHKGDA